MTSTACPVVGVEVDDFRTRWLTRARKHGHIMILEDENVVFLAVLSIFGWGDGQLSPSIDYEWGALVTGYKL